MFFKAPRAREMVCSSLIPVSARSCFLVGVTTGELRCSESSQSASQTTGAERQIFTSFASEDGRLRELG